MASMRFEWLLGVGVAATLLAMSAPLLAEEPAPTTAPVINDCAQESSSEEIVVCRQRQRSAYRLPPAPEGFDPTGTTDSISRERHRLLDVGAAGINSCSTVGPGGYTGCDVARWKEKQEQWAGAPKGEARVGIRVGLLKPALVE
jgi:hypothetical protein